ncbi:peptide-methionine (S)-S-oxide reductase MsrA [Psychromonas ossibalaenae]|uniref:peptide-methionine (S)-S-oxide reductase MsrA n=1 Tax=Psychromonas ossibalaenae TaxID=444922 RepID=UPI0003709502|nr:peptide-methionine (S)-S-oxide reductase MsrA [Psychromonas ossibalaenae]
MAVSTATFAGGCFWCIEAAFNSLHGVIKATSGYTGGLTEFPTYQSICTGKTGHAEAVQIIYQDQQISYLELLTVFFSLHDATQLNRQGNDIGTQYRSAVFYHDLNQKEAAENFILALSDGQYGEGEIQTTVNASSIFYAAEDYHQRYFINNPSQGYCRLVVSPKLNKFKEKYRTKLKAESN